METVKKGRGRPKKIATPKKTDSNDAEESEAGESAEAPTTPKRGRGRPKKIATPPKGSPQRSSPRKGSPQKGKKSPKRFVDQLHVIHSLSKR
jgi:hypothetical protein